MLLTCIQHDVLNKVAAKTKMDCWFSIKIVAGEDMVYDLEENKVMSLRDGIDLLLDGLDSISDRSDFMHTCGLSLEEAVVFQELTARLGLSCPF
jgi:hypothetical protein